MAKLRVVEMNFWIDLLKSAYNTAIKELLDANPGWEVQAKAAARERVVKRLGVGPALIRLEEIKAEREALSQEKESTLEGLYVKLGMRKSWRQTYYDSDVSNAIDGKVREEFEKATTGDPVNIELNRLRAGKRGAEGAVYAVSASGGMVDLYVGIIKALGQEVDPSIAAGILANKED